MLKGWEKRSSREWEHTRLVAWNILAVNRDPKKNFPSIAEYIPLPTDVKIDENSEALRMQKAMDDHKERLKISQ